MPIEPEKKTLKLSGNMVTLPLQQDIQDIQDITDPLPGEIDDAKDDDGSSKLHLFLVFAHDTNKQFKGGWFDLVAHLPTRGIAQITANREFARETVTSVQIVNRFSGVVEWQKTK